MMPELRIILVIVAMLAALTCGQYIGANNAPDNHRSVLLPQGH